ncbi:glycosyltransferase [Kribbella catacumbae]|uniref:glycosyltransferase n=1 Tax=Kribbella catacumbae TaxID=460086 RepID=UPI0003656727|nr:glycosyltransferase [Kribbella catacumbae]
MHVAVIVENVALGVDTRLRKQVDDLLAAGVELSVITMRDDDNDRYRDVPGLTIYEYPAPKQPSGPVGYVGEYLQSFAWASWYLLRLRLRGRIDVLQICQPPDIYFPLAWVLRWAGTRILVDQRDLMPELLGNRYDEPPKLMLKALHWLERRSQRVAHHSLTVNSYLKNRMVEAGAPPRSFAPFSPSRLVRRRPGRSKEGEKGANERGGAVSLVYNGPVLARTSLAVPEPSLHGEHRYLVAWCGKMGRQDRVDLVVKVAEYVVRDLGREDCGFVILGDGECLDELRQLTIELGLERWITFPGWIPEKELFSYLATADLGIDCSLQVEVSPVKVMEYMAQGLPVVCFDLQESRLLADGAGVFTPAGDVPTIASEVVALLDDPTTRKQLGDTGRRLITEQLAWERQTPIYLKAIGCDPSAVAAATAEPGANG